MEKTTVYRVAIADYVGGDSEIYEFKGLEKTKALEFVDEGDWDGLANWIKSAMPAPGKLISRRKVNVFIEFTG
jgi:hypothetical protein